MRAQIPSKAVPSSPPRRRAHGSSTRWIFCGGAFLVAMAQMGPSAQAQQISATLPSLWATRGQDLALSVQVEDPLGVVDRVRYVLWVDGVEIRTLEVDRPSDFRTTLSGDEIWPLQPERLAVRAELLGRRGGLLLSLGEPNPVPLDILTPLQAEARREALAPPPRILPSRWSVTLGPWGQLGSSTWVRGFFRGAHRFGPWEVGAGASVGPNRRNSDGPVSLGGELDLRRYAFVRWLPRLAPFASTRFGVDGRFPGVDPTWGLSVGLHGSARDVAFELQADGTVLYLDETDGRSIQFSGGLRLGLRFAGPDSAP